MGQQHVYSARSMAGIGAAWRDLVAGWRMGDVWRTFAWDEIQSRYRRSFLGLSWIVLSYLVFVASIALFFGGFSQKSGFEFVQHVAIGYAVIRFILGVLSDGCVVFKASVKWIHSTPMPYSVYIYKGVARSTFPFAVEITVALVVMLLMGWLPSLQTLWCLPALACIFLSAVATQMALGYIGARFRDIQHLVTSLQRPVVFLSPVLWVLEEREGVVRQIAMYNPFTHYIQAFRAPLLNQPVPVDSFIIMVALTVAAWVVALVVSSRMRKRLPFWL